MSKLTRFTTVDHQLTSYNQYLLLYSLPVDRILENIHETSYNHMHDLYISNIYLCFFTFLHAHTYSGKSGQLVNFCHSLSIYPGQLGVNSLKKLVNSVSSDMVNSLYSSILACRVRLSGWLEVRT